MPETKQFSVSTKKEIIPEDIDKSLIRSINLGFSLNDQINTPFGVGDIIGESRTEKGKIFYLIPGEAQPRFFVAKNKQQVKEQGLSLVRPVSQRRQKKEKPKEIIQETFRGKREENFIKKYPSNAGECTVSISDEQMSPYTSRFGIKVGDEVKNLARNPSNRLSGSALGVLQKETRGYDDYVGELLFRLEDQSVYPFSISEIADAIKYNEEIKKKQLETELAQSLTEENTEKNEKGQDQQKPNEQSGNILEIRTGTQVYSVDTSELGFKPFSDAFTFSIGDTIKSRDGESLKILGTVDGRVFYKYDNPENFDGEGYYQKDLINAKIVFGEYVRKETPVEKENNVGEYKTADRIYRPDTSEETFKPFSDNFKFSIGDTITDSDGDSLKVLGVIDEELFFRYTRTDYGDEGYASKDLDSSISSFRQYRKPIDIGQDKLEYNLGYGQKVVINTNESNPLFTKFLRRYNIKIGAEIEDKEGDRLTILGVIESSTDSDDVGALFVKYSDSNLGTSFISLDEAKGFFEKNPDADKLKHKESLIAKADRLKDSTSFQALADLIAHDPNLKDEYSILLGRLTEFKKSHISPEEKHRAYTGMLSSIMLSPRLSKLFERVIDQTVEEESSEIKESIKRGDDYTYEVVLGTGIHGTIYNVARQMHFPENPSLSTDQNTKIGGQFGQYGGDAFRLNSRTRPEKRGEEYLPGTNQTLNTFTEFATMQPSDTTAMSYSFQTALARNSRVNFFLSGKAMMEVELQKVKQNPNKEESELILEYIDKESGRILEVKTDRLILASGLGKEITRLNENDSETKRILVEEEAKMENLNNPKVIPFTKFVEWMTNQQNAFPQKDFKKVIISGSGDSGAVIAGMLLGYEGQYGKTTMQLDSVEEIIWLGQSIESKEQFVENVRLRYSQVGLEFPRERIENYYSRIKPISSKSETLKRNGENIVVIAEDGTRHEGDHFIYAHGFEDKTDKIVNSYYNDFIDSPQGIKEFVTEDISRLFGNNCNEVIYKENAGNGIKRIEVLDSSNGNATIRIVRGNGAFTDQTIVLNKLTEDFYREFLNTNTIKGVSISRSQTVSKNRQISVYDKEKSTESPIAIQYESLGREKIPIYKVGPSSKLPLTREETRKSPALANIPENTAAVFRYAKYTEGLANLLSISDKDSDKALEKIKSGLIKPKEKIPWEVKKLMVKEATKIIKTGLFKGKKSNFAVFTNNKDTLSYDENLNDTGRFAMGKFFEKYNFGDTGATIEISLDREGTSIYSGTIVPAIEDESIIESMLGDKLVGAVVERMTNPKNNKNGKLIIRIPIVKGRVDSAGITTTVPR